QGVSGSALASSPRTAAAPPVLKTNNAVAAAVNPPSSGNFLTDIFNQLVQLFQDPTGTLSSVFANPSEWFPLLFFIGYEAFFIPFGTTFWSVLLSSPAWLLLILGVALSAAWSWAAPPAPAIPAVVGAPGTAGQAAGIPAVSLASTGAIPSTGGSTPTVGTAVAAPAAHPR